MHCTASCVLICKAFFDTKGLSVSSISMMSWAPAVTSHAFEQTAILLRYTNLLRSPGQAWGRPPSSEGTYFTAMCGTHHPFLRHASCLFEPSLGILLCTSRTELQFLPGLRAYSFVSDNASGYTTRRGGTADTADTTPLHKPVWQHHRTPWRAGATRKSWLYRRTHGLVLKETKQRRVRVAIL